MFYKVLTTSKYSTMWDLRYPHERLKFSIDKIKNIALDLREDGDYTDLVFSTD